MNHTEQNNSEMKPVSESVARRWLGYFGATFIFLIAVCMGLIVWADPFFHYHAPNPKFYYRMDGGERYLNDGIARNFTYDAIVTGSSMTENFKTTDVDRIFSVHAVKLPFSGASFKEINDNLKTALDTHPEVKLVIRGLDYTMLLDAPDLMRTDLGSYPGYLYDRNIWNDTRYVLNKDVLCNYTLPMLFDRIGGRKGGHKSFDEYAAWYEQYREKFGAGYVLAGHTHSNAPASETPKDADNKTALEQGSFSWLTAEEQENIRRNIEENVTSLAAEHPETEFAYFYTPYSSAFWADLNDAASIPKMLEAEELATQLILEEPNIRLYSFNNCAFTDDLANYHDALHYGPWINTRILEAIKKEEYRLTEENVAEYLREERIHRLTFDYASLR